MNQLKAEKKLMEKPYLMDVDYLRKDNKKQDTIQQKTAREILNHFKDGRNWKFKKIKRWIEEKYKIIY